MSHFLIIIGIGLCTFLPRYIPIVLWKDRDFPEAARTYLSYVPPAVLAAIVAPSLLMPEGGHIAFTLTNPYLIGGVVAMLATLLTKRMLLSSFIGMAAFFAFHSI